jgi:hypothetical protein
MVYEPHARTPKEDEAHEGELLGAFVGFLAQHVNPFARWVRRGRERRDGEERREQERRREEGSGSEVSS